MTAAARGRPPAAPAPIPLDAIARTADGLSVGRDPTVANVVIAHPAVSRVHASLRWDGRTVLVTDLGSTNGTFIEGRRLTAPTPLAPGASLEIGSTAYVLGPLGLEPLAPPSGARLRVDGVSLSIGGGAAARGLLHDVSLALDGAGLLCVLGPSGCGKSTLLKLIAGRVAPTGGRVLVDDVDVHGGYDSMKHRIGYVPQHEALRDELTAADMLRYTARLRLPADLSAAETDDIILGLAERTGLADHLGTRIGALSGGQRRRVGLINEFVGRPSLALLDEVTSGLDEEAAHELMRLVREFASDGMTVVCVTHTVAAVEPYADECLVLAAGGYPAYLGPPAQAPRALGVRSLAEVYAGLNTRPAAEWARRFAASHPSRSVERGHASRQRLGAASPTRPSFGRRAMRGTRVAAVLSQRYADVMLGDARTLALALGQSVVIGSAFRLLFGSAALRVAEQTQLGFLLAVSAFWFGCNNAVKEVVKERDLLRQEWAAGVTLPAYGTSKVVVLAALASLQCLLLLLTVSVLGVDLGDPRHAAARCVLGAMAGTALGLLVSCAAASTDGAATALPILLIPQLLFSEAIVRPLPDGARPVAKAGVAAYWLHQDVRADQGDPTVKRSLPPAMLAAHTGVCLAAAGLVLRRSLRRS